MSAKTAESVETARIEFGINSKEFRTAVRDHHRDEFSAAIDSSSKEN